MKNNLNNSFSIISCSVFKRELQAYLKHIQNKPKSIDFFQIALHLQPDTMRKQLQELLDTVAKRDKVENILLLSGLCGMATSGLKANYSNIIIPRMHDCVSMFLGSAQKYKDLKKEKPRAFFASCGWLEANLMPSKELYDNQLAQYQQKYPDDEELVEDLMLAFFQQYKEYNSYLYAEFFPCQRSKEKCKEYADFMNWDFESILADDSFFKDSLNLNLDDRFLFVPKSKSICASADDNIFKVK